MKSHFCQTLHKKCSYSVLFRSAFFPHFPAFGLNTERYSLSLRIQSKCGKIREKCGPEQLRIRALYMQWKWRQWNKSCNEFHFCVFHVNSYKILSRHWIENVHFARIEILCKHLSLFFTYYNWTWRKHRAQILYYVLSFKDFLKQMKKTWRIYGSWSRWTKVRSSHPEVFLRKGVLKISLKLQENTHAEMRFQ